MRNIFTREAIRETDTHKELLSKKENFKIELLEKRAARERMTNAYQVYLNTKNIPTTVFGSEKSIVEDLIRMNK